MQVNRIAACLVLVAHLSAVGCQSVSPEPAATPVAKPSPDVSPPMAAPATAPESIAELTTSSLAEISGLVFSERQPTLLWVANDSGNPPKLFALNRTGSIELAVDLGVENRDWEDLSMVVINNISYVLVADIGDNSLKQSEYVIHFFREAELVQAGQSTVEPTFSLRFRYADQSHNSEALFSDGTYLYLLTKENLRNGQPVNGGVYRLKIQTEQGPKLSIASRVATLALPNRTLSSRFFARLSGLDLEQPTAASLSRTGNRLYLLNYRYVVVFDKASDEPWARALQRTGTRLHTHGLPQAEALGVAPNGDVWVMSEKLPAELWRFPSANKLVN